MSRWKAMTIVAFVLAACVSDCSVAVAQDASSSDVDAIVMRANELRRLNRKAEALTRARRAAVLAPHRADVAQLRALLEHEVHGAEVTLGFSHEGWNDAREPRREAQLGYRQNTVRGPIVTRATRVARFGLQDANIEVEAYPAFPGGYASLALGVAATGELYARSTMSAELFKMLTARHEGSIGYRRLEFPEAVNVFTGSFGNYVRQYLVGARVNHVTAGARGTTASLFLRRYLADDGQYVGAYAITGTIREDVHTVTDFDVRSSSSAGAEALFIVKSRWLLTTRQLLGRDNIQGGGSAFFCSFKAGLGARF